MGRYPFDVLDMVHILKLTIRRDSGFATDVDCPFCNKRGKLHLDKTKQVFRCNYCGHSGNLITLYAELCGMSNKEAYWEICRLLHCEENKLRNLKKAKDIKDKKHLAKMQIADLEIRHKTYQHMLEILTLTERNKWELQQRGLSENAIVYHEYRSTPTRNRKQIVDILLQRGCILKGVPGFYVTRNGEWSINMSSKLSGVLIPIRNAERKIQGLQIRLNQVLANGTKYIWLSSVNYEQGVSPCSPIHIAGCFPTETIYITEGALKAEIAHELTGKTFIAVAGVNQYRSLSNILLVLKELGVKWIVEAYDMDKFNNVHVMYGCIVLSILAQKMGFLTKNLYWNLKYKGIDDVNKALKDKEILNPNYGYYDILTIARNNFDIEALVKIYDTATKYIA